MPDDTEETREIVLSDLEKWLSLEAPQAKKRDKLTNPQEFILVVNGIARHVKLDQTRTVVLGRVDSPGELTVDLSDFGASDHGVSARHAQLHVKGNALYIIDLDSTNGTTLRGKRLQPGKQERVNKGDTVTLARLTLRILF